ncbi:MAG: hypothetical protein OHK0018_14000 [Erythrobacter tepidarius]
MVSRPLGVARGPQPGTLWGACHPARRGDRGKKPATHRRTGLEALPQDLAKLAASGRADINALAEAAA